MSQIPHSASALESEAVAAIALGTACALSLGRRGPGLFEHFLPPASRLVVLSSVPPGHRPLVALAIELFAVLTTIYDDLADYPDPASRDRLMTLLPLVDTWEARLGDPGVARADDLRGCCRRLWFTFARICASFPHFETLRDLLWFDVVDHVQIHRYSQLLERFPCLWLEEEARVILPRGIAGVLFGGVCLMASPGLVVKELGALRRIFIDAQAHMSWANQIASLPREAEAGVVASILLSRTPLAIRGDAVALDAHLNRETEGLLASLSALSEGASALQSFDVPAYLGGVREICILYASLRGQV